MTNPSSPRQRPYPPPPTPHGRLPGSPAADTRRRRSGSCAAAEYGRAQHQPRPLRPSRNRNAQRVRMAALVLAAVGVALGLVPLTGSSLPLRRRRMCSASSHRGRAGVWPTTGISIAGTVLSTIALVLGIWGRDGVGESRRGSAGPRRAQLQRAAAVTQSRGDSAGPKPCSEQLAARTYWSARIQPGSYRTAGGWTRAPRLLWSRNLDASGRSTHRANSTPTARHGHGQTPDGAFHTSGCSPGPRSTDPVSVSVAIAATHLITQL